MNHKIEGLSNLVRVYRHKSKHVNASERAHQINAVSWFDATYPHLKKSLIHIPNETQSKISHQSTLNKMGRRSGAPDLILAHANIGLGYPYAMIEMKASKGSLSSNQKEMLSHHAENGAFCAVCFGFEAFKEAVKYYVES
jgi:hypothetical protein